MEHVSILGTWTLKDIFAFHKDKNEYVIDGFVQNCNPLSMVMASPLQKAADAEFDEVFSGQPKFYQRCARQDAEKSVLKYFSEMHSDWLVVDLAELRWKLYVTSKGGGTYRHPEEIKKLQEMGYLDTFKTMTSESLKKDNVMHGIDLFFGRITRLFPEDRIILADIHAAKNTVNRKDNKGNEQTGKDYSKINTRITQAVQHTIDKMKNCHYIPFPENTPADYDHKWGYDPLHYVPEYYEYAYQAMQIITKRKYDIPKEREQIDKLRKQYEKRMQEKYGAEV